MSQVYIYDMTIAHTDANKNEIQNWLTQYTKKWAFQLEEGKTGYKHWQIRFSLKEKKRKSELIKLIGEKWHVTPTSSGGSKTFDYVIKTDTRIEGPWTDADEPIYIPRQYRITPYPWQQDIIDNIGVWDTRTINVIYDKHGNIGKSTIVGHICSQRLAGLIPPLNDYRDLLASVLDRPTYSMYLIDMPKAIKKENLFNFWSAIETIKNGYAFDTRYKYREKWFDSPNIWVFSNQVPETSMLSNDRWKIWEIHENKLRNFQAGSEEPCNNSENSFHIYKI